VRATDIEVEVTLRAHLWDLRLDIISCQNVAVQNLQSCIYGIIFVIFKTTGLINK
jgi:hypothetical protein